MKADKNTRAVMVIEDLHKDGLERSAFYTRTVRFELLCKNMKTRPYAFYLKKQQQTVLLITLGCVTFNYLKKNESGLKLWGQIDMDTHNLLGLKCSLVYRK